MASFDSAYSDGSGTFTGALIIYQSGLGCDEKDFYKTISKLVASNGYRHKAYLDDSLDEKESFIETDLWDGNPSTIGNHFTKTVCGKKFTIKDYLNHLINFCSNNKKYNIHIRTHLSGSNNYDSIEQQAKRLKSIIEYLDSNPNFDRNIILVGHSQGGLVNLKVATEIPNLINKLISISTPYSPVSVGRDALALFHLGELFNININGELVNVKFVKNNTAAQQFRDSLGVLTSSDFYKDLKEKWNNLTNKPKLLVISGTSGKLAYTSTSYDIDGTSISVTNRYAFDGLITTQNQHNISYNKYQPLVDLDIECLYREQGNFTGNYQTFCGKCGRFSTKACDLPTLNMTYLSQSTLMKGICSWIKGEGFQIDKEGAKLFETIDAAAYPDYKNDRYYPNTNPHSEYDYIYKIYSHKYSHGWIRYNDLTIYSIRSFIE